MKRSTASLVVVFGTAVGGNITQQYGEGVIEKVLLPDGSFFISAGGSTSSLMVPRVHPHPRHWSHREPGRLLRGALTLIGQHCREAVL